MDSKGSVAFSGDSQMLAYDLRQRYAKIVGDQLEIVAALRREHSFADYFGALEDLYTIVAHKFKSERKDGKEIGYEKLRQKLIDLSNKYPGAWQGTSNNSEEIALIDSALREIERHLYSKMEERHMFGSKWADEGL